MVTHRDRARSLFCLGAAVFLILVIGMVTGGQPGGGILAQGATCGNGIVEPGEQCDDGNKTDFDGCSSTCQFIFDFTGEKCLGSSKSVDPDEAGPLSSRIYCVINGRLATGEAIEIDDVDGAFPSGSPLSAADANLQSGADDPNNLNGGNRHLPAVTGATYIDWNDLPGLTTLSAGTIGSVEDFHIVDFIASGGTKDATAMNGECLQASSSAGKAELSQVYVANNEKFLYVGLERVTNNGNTASYWLLTKEPPIAESVAGCVTGPDVVGQLKFNLSDGDVEILVNSPSGGDKVGDGRAFIRTFDHTVGNVSSPTGYVVATAAVAHAGWGGVLIPVANMAFVVSTIGTGKNQDKSNLGDEQIGYWGSFDDQGHILLPGPNGTFGDAEFLEFAVDLDSIFPNQALCGQKLYLTGLSRASTGAQDLVPTENSSLMDEVGPKLYSFGAISGEAQLKPLPCGNGFRYCADAKDLSGQPLQNVTGHWECTATDVTPDNADNTVHFSDPNKIVSCDADVNTMPTALIDRNGNGSAHNVNCTVVLSDPASTCSISADTSAVVAASLKAINISGLDCTLQSCNDDLQYGFDRGTIGDGITFNVDITGGSGQYTIVWSFPDGTGVPGQQVPGVSCPASPNCTIHLPDAGSCANIPVHLFVRDAINPFCAPLDFDFGFIQKATIIKFNRVPNAASEVTCSAVSCPQ